MRRRWRWVRDLALVVGALLLLHAVQTRSLPQGPAPPLGGRLVGSDEPLALAELRGRPVLVHFRASWCPVCRLMEGSIAQIAAEHQVLGVASQSGDAAEVAAYLEGAQHPFPTLVDPSGQLAAARRLRGVPTSFVIDAAGQIRFVEVGYTSGLGLRARLWAASLW